MSPLRRNRDSAGSVQKSSFECISDTNRRKCNATRSGTNSHSQSATRGEVSVEYPSHVVSAGPRLSSDIATMWGTYRSLMYA